ncbi:PREDICTED: putative phosphatidylglycerol/phosphatidylinositol transfer protein DDB_G0278295 [Ipomoea nil]|uniref:putative phosphatidylglycerol/phosphatidylinositol transfer protein DDB_G0278295 n=1 Tax=Ipomoea nil TaxID=35883 RepID=UPI000901F090|nr:PREDICTED: putative phosphatidylglycerol/phosphatidylinositol transfer protein DDB_G0278295 [Ipomoea nil]
MAISSKPVVALFFSLCVFLPLISAMSTDIKYCSQANYAVKVTGADITPFPVKRGDNATFSITAATDKGMVGGKLGIHVLYYGMDIYHETYNICAETSCPISTGYFVLSHTQKLPQYTPTGEFSLKMTILDEEDNELTCITFDFVIGVGIGLIAKSKGILSNFL